MKEKGQSLIEMVIALAVTLVAIVALVQVSVTAIRNANFAKNQTLATNYAQAVVEKVRAYRDENDWSTFVDNCAAQDVIGVGILPPSLGAMELGCTCLDTPANCEVRVQVSWTDAQGPHETELTTYLTEWK